jgi:hypothetical protein
LKGILQQLGDVPSWIKLGDGEKVDWLNDLLAKAWPFLDKKLASGFMVGTFTGRGWETYCVVVQLSSMAGRVRLAS